MQKKYLKTQTKQWFSFVPIKILLQMFSKSALETHDWEQNQII